MQLTDDQFAVLTDAIERAWCHWPAVPDPDNNERGSTSDYARKAARRIVRECGWQMPGAFIHMATSGQDENGTWGWVCRCDESGSGYTSKAAAREAGDEHLGKANGNHSVVTESDGQIFP